MLLVSEKIHKISQSVGIGSVLAAMRCSMNLKLKSAGNLVDDFLESAD